MRKANQNTDVIVGKFFRFSPEELLIFAKRLEVAIKERVNPGESAVIEAAPGLYFYHDPQLLRGDLERKIFVERTESLTAEVSEIVTNP